MVASLRRLTGRLMPLPSQQEMRGMLADTLTSNGQPLEVAQRIADGLSDEQIEGLMRVALTRGSPVFMRELISLLRSEKARAEAHFALHPDELAGYLADPSSYRPRGELSDSFRDELSGRAAQTP